MQSVEAQEREVVSKEREAVSKEREVVSKEREEEVGFALRSPWVSRSG